MRDLRMATILQVLVDRYTAEARTDKGDWARKITLIGTQLTAVINRIQLRFGPTADTPPDSPPIFNTKISR